MITFNIITLFPSLFEPFIHNPPLSKAISKRIIEVNLIQLRDFSIDRRGTIDGRPYGGGIGMILRVEPVYDALESIHGSLEKALRLADTSIIALSPSGKKFTQQKAMELSKKRNITLICGRYEGMDQRIKDHMVTDVISIGDYILSGGELPSLVIMESISRLLPGVLEKRKAVEIESFADGDCVLEYPQYTRPKSFKRMDVPSVLLSGDHEKIKKWREAEQDY